MTDDDPLTMRAMVCESQGAPLVLRERPVPQPGPGEVVLRVLACGVCRTDLHVQDAELPEVTYPVIPGHQVVGEVAASGDGAGHAPGARLGVAWLGWTCGHCDYCRRGLENLCDGAEFHGLQRDGGYAQFMRADARFCFPLDRSLDAAATTPLLCAGLIGYRSLRMAGDAARIGIYGFGSAAHVITQVARAEGREIYAFTSPGDVAAQGFAREMGARWAGGSDEPAPTPLDAALVFAPVGALVPKALRDVRKGGVVVCGGIHMSDIPGFPYRDLWHERQVRSVANLTRRDGHDFMALAARTPIRTRISTYPLERANDALDALREGRLAGTAVLVPSR